MKRLLLFFCIMLLFFTCKSRPDIEIVYDDFKDATIAVLEEAHYETTIKHWFTGWGSKYIREIGNGETLSFIWDFFVYFRDTPFLKEYTEYELEPEAHIIIDGQTFITTLINLEAHKKKYTPLFAEKEKCCEMKLNGDMVFSREIEARILEANSMSYNLFVKAIPTIKLTIEISEKELQKIKNLLLATDLKEETSE